MRMDFASARPASVTVLADDLTSAGDGAAPFLAAGYPARILLEPSAETIAAGVTAVDLDSRRLPEQLASDRTEQAARDLAESSVLFKTIDSTLRGHVAAETRAALTGSRRVGAVIAPAFPAEARTTEHGVQMVHGVPVHDSEFARDPAHQVHCSDLMVLLPGAVLVEPTDVARLPELIGQARLLVCSARTDHDLDRLVAAVPRLDDVLWVGSPGLAAALARRCAITSIRTVPTTPPARRLLVIVGSANPTTRRQLAQLTRLTGVNSVAVTDDYGGTIARLRAAPGEILALHTPHTRCAADEVGRLTQRLAAIAQPLAADGTIDALILTGGETARAVLSALGASGIDLLDEPEPGVAAGRLRGGPECLVLVKAGGFGDDDTLVRLSRLMTIHPHVPGRQR